MNTHKFACQYMPHLRHVLPAGEGVDGTAPRHAVAAAAHHHHRGWVAPEAEAAGWGGETAGGARWWGARLVGRWCVGAAPASQASPAGFFGAGCSMHNSSSSVARLTHPSAAPSWPSAIGASPSWPSAIGASPSLACSPRCAVCCCCCCCWRCAQPANRATSICSPKLTFKSTGASSSPKSWRRRQQKGLAATQRASRGSCRAQAEAARRPAPPPQHPPHPPT